MIFFGFFLLIYLVFKTGQSRRRVVFELKNRIALRCGCVLEREEISGKSRLAPCAAHRAMAESL